VPMDFRKVLKDRHRWALQHKETGGLVMGCYSALLPEELMWSCNVLPLQFLMSPGPYDEALPHLPPYVCDCSRSIFEDCEDGTYSYLDGLMVSHVCETIRGLAGILSVRSPKRYVRIFTAPAANDPGARSRLKAELLSLSKELEQLGGVSLTRERLEESISVYNENRGLVEELYRMRGETPGAVEPEQVLCAVLDAHNRMMREFLKTVSGGPHAPGIRVILSGLLFENEALLGSEFFSLLNACHVHVVWDDLASGMRYRLEPVDASLRDDPLDRLAESLLGPQPAPLRSPSERKARQILRAARTYDAQGVIFLVPKYCDPMLFDLPPLIQILKGNGLPTLSIEISGAFNEGSMRTRIEAFVEMLSA